MPSLTGSRVGRVSALWRYPVKSMQGETVTASHVTDRGLLGDRSLALYDEDSGRVASAKSPRLWPDLLEFAAAFVAAPRPDQPLPPVRVTLPSGEVTRTDEPDVEARLSEATGRRVRLITSNPDGGSFEQYVPPLDGAEPGGTGFYRDTPNDLFGTGSLHDAASLHLLTEATLARFSELYPDGDFDARRFRPNVVVATDGPPGFVENAWPGSTLALGAVAIRVTAPMVRCVMTTVAQQDLPKDLGILRAAVEHNRRSVLDWDGTWPCVGVGARITGDGRLALGDAAVLHG